MNLEQIVKETVAKMVDEKHLTAAETKKKEDIVMAMKKDFKGPKAAMYAIATDKAKKLAEAVNKIKLVHKGPSDNPDSNYMQYTLTVNGDDINAEEFAKGWKVIRYDDWEGEWKDVRNPKKQEIIDFINAYNEKQPNNLNEDYEVAMAQDSLDSIIRAAMMLKTQMGDQEVNLPAWIQDHITNSENYINQAAKGYHESDAQIDDEAGESEELDENKMDKEELKQAQIDKAYDHLEKMKENTKLFSKEDIKKAEDRIEKLEAELDALAEKSTNESLDEFTVRRWQHYAGIK
jgi:hypothetical protein